jgi:hypothetical protein
VVVRRDIIIFLYLMDDLLDRLHNIMEQEEIMVVMQE